LQANFTGINSLTRKSKEVNKDQRIYVKGVKPLWVPLKNIDKQIYPLKIVRS